MKLTLVDNFLWAAVFAANVVLLVIMVSRARWREFPVLTALAGFDAALTVALFVIYRHGSPNLYAIVYWSTAFIDFALQLALIFEISRIVLKPTGTWARDARATFLTWGSVGAVIALALVYAVHPLGSSSNLASWELRANLFTDLLVCELFLAMMFAAHRLGLVWRNHVMGLAQGLTAWAIVSAFVDTAHTYLGSHHDFTLLDHVSMFVYLGAQVYWIVTFWLPEPARRPLSPEMQQYLVALHEKVAYDLTRVRNASGSR